MQYDYRPGNGEFVASCTGVAIRLAKALLAEGKTPRILTMESAETDAHGHKTMLKPLPYQGRVTWGAHIICESEGMVFDPILDKPVAIADYPNVAFNQRITITDDSDILEMA